MDWTTHRKGARWALMLAICAFGCTTDDEPGDRPPDRGASGRTINASAILCNRGGRLGLEGSGSLRFANQRFAGEFYAFPGSFEFSASLAASGRAGPLSAEGRVSVFAGTPGFGATFRGQGCTDTPVGPAWVEASVTVDSNGVICLAFPVGVGFNCVDVLQAQNKRTVTRRARICRTRRRAGSLVLGLALPRLPVAPCPGAQSAPAPTTPRHESPVTLPTNPDAPDRPTA